MLLTHDSSTAELDNIGLQNLYLEMVLLSSNSQSYVPNNIIQWTLTYPDPMYPAALIIRTAL